MPTIPIKNFPYGLDVRRFSIGAPLGTLTKAENVHINQGGEVEKRSKFVLSTAVANTFDVVSDGTKVCVFGSADLASGIDDDTYRYVRCQHPVVSDGGTYIAGPHDMTAIVAATAHAGKAVCFARFGDDNVYGYVDGVLIEQTRAGLVLAGASDNDDIAAQIMARLNAEVADLTVERTNDSLSIRANLGDTFELDVSETSALGSFTQATISNGSNGTLPVNATCGFTFVTMSTDANFSSLLAPAPDDPLTGHIELLANPVNYSLNMNNTVALLRDEINRTASGYTASASGANLYIYAPASMGDSANGNGTPNVHLTYTGTVTFTTTGEIALAVSVSGSRSVTVKSYGAATKNISIPLVAIPVGGTSPYSLLWQGPNPGVAIGSLGNYTLTPVSSTNASVTFTAQSVKADDSATASVKISVVDSADVSVELNLTLTFICLLTDTEGNPL